MMYRRRNMPEAQLEMFFDTSFNCEHRPLIRKQMEMVQWQLGHTPGYMGAVLSSYRYFPLAGMGDLFSVAGRRDRPVLILWGNNDNMFPLRKALPTLEHSFPAAEIISIQQCGHNPLFEKFEDVATAVVDFYKHME
jgi:pimeloyl-ACP methyl ester carboxylesterase